MVDVLYCVYLKKRGKKSMYNEEFELYRQSCYEMARKKKEKLLLNGLIKLD